MNESSNDMNRFNYKLVLLGESGVGKSSICLRYVRGQFFEYQESTIGAAFLRHDVKLLDVEMWGMFLRIISFTFLVNADTAGKERYKSLAPMYYRGANLAIVIYDITDYETFTKAKNWVRELKRQASADIKIALCGNKADMEDARRVESGEAVMYAEEQNCVFCETSAKSGDKIDEVFLRLIYSLPKFFSLKPRFSGPVEEEIEEEVDEDERERLEFLCSEYSDFQIPLKHTTLNLFKCLFLDTISEDFDAVIGSLKDMSLGNLDEFTVLKILISEKFRMSELDKISEYYAFFRKLGLLREINVVLENLKNVKKLEQLQNVFVESLQTYESKKTQSYFFSEESTLEEFNSLFDTELCTSLLNRIRQLVHMLLSHPDTKSEIESLENNLPHFRRTVEVIRFINENVKKYTSKKDEKRKIKFSSREMKKKFQDLSEKMQRLHSGESSNVILKTRDLSEFRCHIFVLVWKSNYFYRMLHFGGVEAEELRKDGVISLTVISTEELDFLLSYFYLGKIEIEPSIENLKSLVQAVVLADRCLETEMISDLLKSVVLVVSKVSVHVMFSKLREFAHLLLALETRKRVVEALSCCVVSTAPKMLEKKIGRKVEKYVREHEQNLRVKEMVEKFEKLEKKVEGYEGKIVEQQKLIEKQRQEIIGQKKRIDELLEKKKE